MKKTPLARRNRKLPVQADVRHVVVVCRVAEELHAQGALDAPLHAGEVADGLDVAAHHGLPRAWIAEILERLGRRGPPWAGGGPEQAVAHIQHQPGEKPASFLLTALASREPPHPCSDSPCRKVNQKA